MLSLARTNKTFVLLTALVSFTGCGDGCGGDESPPEGGGGTTTVSTTGGGGAGGTGGTGGVEEGGAGGTLMCESNEGVTFALTQLSFGEGNNGQWKTVGRNLDGLVSDGKSTDVCQPNSGGNPDTAYPDGEAGIDNSFGKNLLPIILGLSPMWPTAVNTALDEGRFNTMLKVYCLPETGNAQLITKVFGGTNLGATPKYDGTDLWPVAPEILGDPMDPESSTLVFENSSVSGTTYNSGADETFILAIPMTYMGQTASLKLTLYHAQITMDLSADRKSATGGVIGGVLNTEELIDQVKKVAFMADLCEGATYQSILTAVRQTSDIMADGTQDPSQTCDGISFGVHFEMSEVQLGDVGPAAPLGNACP